MPITKQELDVLAESIAKMVKAAITPLKERIEVLERRPELKYCGVHREGDHYTPGALVTRGGSLWFCERETEHYPGSRDSGWRLIAKAGSA
jgi:hypothetical protein